MENAEESGALTEVSARALRLYTETLQAQLEPASNGQGVAIHPDSGDYVVAATPTFASRAMWKRHPKGAFVTLRIGLELESGLGAQVASGQRRSK